MTSNWGQQRRSKGHQWYKTPQWQRLRRKVMVAANYKCAIQGKDCRIVASEVDHVVSHLGNKSRFFDLENLQAICRVCHSRKTAREVLGKGSGFDADGMPLDPDHHWNRE